MTGEASCTRTFPEGSMFRGVVSLKAAMYNNKEVLVCGGNKGFPGVHNPLRSCHSLDLHNPTAKWEVAPELPMSLYFHAMTTIGESGAVAVTGGKRGRSLDKHI